MGNSLGCISPEEEQKKLAKYPNQRLSLMPSFKGRRSFLTSLSSSKKKSKKKNRERADHDIEKDSLIKDQNLAANLLFNQHDNPTPRNSSSVPCRRSTSVVYPTVGPDAKKQSGAVRRSSSSRQRSSTDHLLGPNQLVNKQDLKVEGLETKRFVLVHGGGFGAWCWYKTMSLLEKDGFQVDAVDLTGSGVSSFDTNSITSLAQYVKPLINFFDNLKNGEKVILVGHDFGGACISYVMEMYPSKIAKAVFVAAAMLTNGQSTLDLFSQQSGSNDLMRQAQVFLYANGRKNPPTAIDLEKTLLKELLFNQSPTKDITLASVSMRPIPFTPVVEKLHLSDKNYGSVRRFYIKALEDYAVPLILQEAMVKLNPPEQVFQLKGADHSPFFSRPQALNRILVEISQIPSKKG